MIAGNPKAARTLMAIAIAALFIMLLGTLIVARWKRTAPQQEPPLHPATTIPEILQAVLRIR